MVDLSVKCDVCLENCQNNRKIVEFDEKNTKWITKLRDAVPEVVSLVIFSSSSAYRYVCVGLG